MVYPQSGPAAPKYLISSCQVQTHSGMCVGVKDNQEYMSIRHLRILEQGLVKGSRLALEERNGCPRFQGYCPEIAVRILFFHKHCTLENPLVHVVGFERYQTFPAS